MVWELMGRLSVEHAAEVWNMQQKCGGQEGVVRASWSRHGCEWVVGDKQYSSRRGIAGRSRVEEAGGEEGIGESVVW